MHGLAKYADAVFTAHVSVVKKNESAETPLVFYGMA